MRRRYFTLDVFTTQRFAGNPLAVVLDSDGLETPAMQTIAREFNLPETVFVYPASDPKHRARVRIFTPGRELPFAGHPTVGTAVLLAHLDGGASPRELVLVEQVGPVACKVTPGEGCGHASFDIPKLPERLGAVPDLGRLAAALSLKTSDIGGDGFVVERWNAGNGFTFVPVKGLEAIARARPDMGRWGEVIGPDDPQGVFLFCREVAEKGHSFHARMFAPGLGVIEDPATGSAVAAFAGPLSATRPGDGQHAYIIEQGYEMGRRSLLNLTLNMSGGSLTGAVVGGDTVLVSEGVIEA
jgi:trans-2,3-dihydro-3-hydroxyanthranilate isomerase